MWLIRVFILQSHLGNAQESCAAEDALRVIPDSRIAAVQASLLSLPTSSVVIINSPKRAEFSGCSWSSSSGKQCVLAAMQQT